MFVVFFFCIRFHLTQQKNQVKQTELEGKQLRHSLFIYRVRKKAEEDLGKT